MRAYPIVLHFLMSKCIRAKAFLVNMTKVNYLSSRKAPKRNGQMCKREQINQQRFNDVSSFWVLTHHHNSFESAFYSNVCINV